MYQSTELNDTDRKSTKRIYNEDDENDEECAHSDESLKEENMIILLPDELITYNNKTWKRMIKKSKPGVVPHEKGFTTPCLLWTGTINNGYGRMFYRTGMRYSHCVAYMIYYNLIELPKMNNDGELLEIRHLCDVTLCFAKDHLQLGTKAENGEDRTKHGLTRGENHHNASINEELASKIKWSKPLGKEARSKGHKTQKQRAEEYGVSYSVVQHIDIGHTWSHLPFSDGTTSEAKAKQIKEREVSRRKKLKKTPWTKEQWMEVEQKLQDPDYVREHPTKHHDGILCKEWIRSTNNGYGEMSIHGTSIGAHIAACVVGNNYERIENMEAAHQCGFTFCVEPMHLKFETPKENAEDKIEHGTFASKLSFDEIEEIRAKYEKGDVSQQTLADEYGVVQSYISAIILQRKRKKG